MKCLAVILLLLSAMTGAVGSQKPAEWIRYISAEGRYGVLLPSQPEIGTQESATADGTKFTQHKATVVEGSSVFLIGYFDHVPGTEFSFDRARDGMVAAVNGTLLKESVISLGGAPGRDLNVLTKDDDGSEFLLHARFYEIDKRVYVVQFIFPKSLDSEAKNAEAAKYFDSFQVVK